MESELYHMADENGNHNVGPRNLEGGGSISGVDFELREFLALHTLESLIILMMVTLVNYIGVFGLVLREGAVMDFKRNIHLFVKVPIIIAVQTIVYFGIGIGISIDQHGGIIGGSKAFGHLPEVHQQKHFVTYLSLSLY